MAKSVPSDYAEIGRGPGQGRGLVLDCGLRRNDRGLGAMNRAATWNLPL